ncbi:hypothetical protein C8R43DRAFT_1129479 [Mycena crocata]|nr:hypothetical protein C8R43DRAFT_1129479 [Mycena crocata]
MPAGRIRWSRLPAEIALEIAGHNATDVPTLRTMALVSKAMRFLAIEHLFSSIHLSCVEDLDQWLDMLLRTPGLTNIVKKVAFKNLSKPRGKRRPLFDAAMPPKIPSMSNVSTVEWWYDVSDGTKTAAYMALFPNMQTLCLCAVDFKNFLSLTNFLGSCGILKSLSFRHVSVSLDHDSDLEYEDDEDEDSRSEDSQDADSQEENPKNEDSGVQPSPTDPKVENAEGGGIMVPSERIPLALAHLKELLVTGCNDSEDEDFILTLLERSCPVGLASLNFHGPSLDEGEYCNDTPCSTSSMGGILRLTASTLVNLIPPDIASDLYQLPGFPALVSLTLRVDETRQTSRLLYILPAAPKLTTLIIRIVLEDYGDDSGASETRENFKELLESVFPLTKDESLRAVLMPRFPQFNRLKIHICVPRDSYIHFRRGMRRKMEGQLKQRLEETDADTMQYMETEWLDEQFLPVCYSKTNGKPPWRFTNRYRSEPITEASNCQSEDSDDEWPPRVWTEAHERAYRREMLEEIRGDYYPW